MLNMIPLDLIQKEIDESSSKALKIFNIGSSKFKTIHLAKDSFKIPVEFNTYLFKFKDKNVILGISCDISERKKAEKQLKETIKELERSNQELQQFEHVASHDLQEPLRIIVSFTQLLERRYKGQLDSNADEFMDYIVEASFRMKAQIDGLLEYSRVLTKGEELKNVDMDNALNQALKILDTQIKGVDAEITYDELPNVIGDALQFERVFQNLISNAIKFRKHDEQLKIHISAYETKEGKDYVFSVQDNGIGIEEQYFERIFIIFQRLHTRDVYEGTGIGLSIVKRIVKRHGGRVWVESEFGEGSTFYFTIPIKD
ncbi:MAG: sensor histidine kinase [Methanobacterium sp.]